MAVLPELCAGLRSDPRRGRASTALDGYIGSIYSCPVSAVCRLVALVRIAREGSTGSIGTVENRTVIALGSSGSLRRGVRLNGMYEIETLIAQGGMGEVYK